VHEEITYWHWRKTPGTFLMVKQATRSRVIRIPEVNVLPTVIIKIEHLLRHDALIPTLNLVGPLQAGHFIAGTLKPHIGLVRIEKNLSRIRASSDIPVNDLSGHKIYITIVIDIGACGRTTIASQPERLSALPMIPPQNV